MYFTALFLYELKLNPTSNSNEIKLNPTSRLANVSIPARFLMRLGLIPLVVPFTHFTEKASQNHVTFTRFFRCIAHYIIVFFTHNFFVFRRDFFKNMTPLLGGQAQKVYDI